MEQFLIIIRGAAASGKTTIAKRFRNFEKKIVWLKVDNYKEFFAQNASLSEQKYVDECALATLKYLLDNGFSVVMEKIFFNPDIIPLSVDEAKKRNIKVRVFQIKCPIEVLQERDKRRPGIKKGCRKPLGNEVIKKIHDQLQKTYYPGSIELDTEKLNIDESVKKIQDSLIGFK